MVNKALLRNQGFNPVFWGLFTNRFYFVRKGLYESIKSYAHNIQGKVLDVGCGSKPYQSLFNVSSYTGLDYDKNGINKKSDADFIYDGTSFPFENEVHDSCI